MDIAQMLSVAISFLGIFLLLMIYTYIDKLEKTGCECSESPYRAFIKYFPLVAVLYLVLTMAFSAGYIIKMLGPSGSLVYMLIRAAFVILFFIFFILVIVYVRNLIITKCECSEDIRREVMYLYAILEVVMLSLSVVFILLESIIQGAYVIGVNTVKTMSNDSGRVNRIVNNPLNSIGKIPKDLGKDLGALSKSLKKTISKTKGKK
jgi:hypothetical protein